MLSPPIARSGCVYAVLYTSGVPLIGKLKYWCAIGVTTQENALLTEAFAASVTTSVKS